jgi:hypothetical protein
MKGIKIPLKRKISYCLGHTATGHAFDTVLPAVGTPLQISVQSIKPGVSRKNRDEWDHQF